MSQRTVLPELEFRERVGSNISWFSSVSTGDVNFSLPVVWTLPVS